MGLTEPTPGERRVVQCEGTGSEVVAEYEGAPSAEYGGWLHLHDDTVEEDKEAVRVFKSNQNPDLSDEGIVVPEGFASTPEAFRSGFRRERDTSFTEYPGPDRVAHQAGWVERQRVEAGQPRRYR